MHKKFILTICVLNKLRMRYGVISSLSFNYSSSKSLILFYLCFVIIGLQIHIHINICILNTHSSTLHLFKVGILVMLIKCCIMLIKLNNYFFKEVELFNILSMFSTQICYFIAKINEYF